MESFFNKCLHEKPRLTKSQMNMGVSKDGMISVVIKTDLNMLHQDTLLIMHIRFITHKAPNFSVHIKMICPTNKRYVPPRDDMSHCDMICPTTAVWDTVHCCYITTQALSNSSPHNNFTG